MRNCIVRPLISEKNSLLSVGRTYVFEVLRDATKDEVKNAVEANFGSKVESVRTLVGRGRGKPSRFGAGRVPRFKKAFVKLKAGEKIGLFEGV